MRKNCTLVVVAFLAGMACTLNFVHSQPQLRVVNSFEKELTVASKLKEDQVLALLNVLGPAVVDQIAAGRQVSLPGLGTFRVVQLEAQKNLEDGRVVTQPATNVIEFLPDGAMNQAANAPGAVPAVVVPAFQYNILPGSAPSTKVPYNRTPSTRVR